jgi:hypothetical protein
MFARTKVTAAILSLLVFSGGFWTRPVSAQQNRQSGLVNVAVFDIIDDVTVVVQDVNVGVGVAANIAANVCGVSVPVAVLSTAVVGGSYTCDNGDNTAGVTISQL